MTSPIPGIDASLIQGDITPDQWREIVARGTRFAIFKCGNGNDAPDDSFARNVERAQAEGIIVGCYHVTFTGLPADPRHPGRDPVEQARAHFAQCAGLGSGNGELTAFADMEWVPPDLWGRPVPNVDNSIVTRDSALGWQLTYLAEYSRLQGRPMGLYSYLDFLDHLKPTGDFARYPLWLAEYGPSVTPVFPWAGWCAWQTSGGGGRLPSGVPVDTDEIADEAVLKLLTGG